MAKRLQKALTEARIDLDVQAADAREVLAALAGLMAHSAAEAQTLAAALLAREHTGATALGNGVAVPHARVAGITEIRAAFVRTRTPVSFAAPDGLPVDLYFGLIVPVHANTEHLELLGEIAELLSDESAVRALREARSPATIRSTLLERPA
jgi:PTS system nitrogen regulatory IIA component